MKLIAGLGNPGPEYARTRHNVGFVVLDELARRWAVDLSRYDRSFEALVGEAQRRGQRVLLLKPMTYMNLSGRSVAAVVRFYKLDLADLLVISDDMDLPLGHLRMRAAGSAGGQRGLADIIRHLSSEAFARLRIGIGRSGGCGGAEHVLGTFAPDERATIEEAVSRAADAAECWLERGVQTAMNEYNRSRI